MALTGVSGYKKLMTRFWALAVAVVSTLGVAGQLVAQDTPTAKPGEPREPVDELSAPQRAHHIDEYTQAAVLRYPGLKAAEADIVTAQARLDEARLSPFFQFQGQARLFVRPGAQGTPTSSPHPQLPWRNRRGPTGCPREPAGPG